MIPIICDPEKPEHEAPVDSITVTARLIVLLAAIIGCMAGICYMVYSIGGK